VGERKRRRKPCPDVHLLRQKYAEEKVSRRELMLFWKVGDTTICRWLYEANIPVRSSSEAQKLAWGKPRKHPGLHSDATRQKQSKTRRALWASGAYDNRRSRVPFYEYGAYKLRSKWEVRLAQVFDTFGWDWEYEAHHISYRLDDGEHTYTPDFYVSDLDVYFDPHWNFYSDATPKFKAVREQTGIVLIVLDEELIRVYEQAAGLT